MYFCAKQDNKNLNSVNVEFSLSISPNVCQPWHHPASPYHLKTHYFQQAFQFT